MDSRECLFQIIQIFYFRAILHLWLHVHWLCSINNTSGPQVSTRTGGYTVAANTSFNVWLLPVCQCGYCLSARRRNNHTLWNFGWQILWWVSRLRAGGFRSEPSLSCYSSEVVRSDSFHVSTTTNTTHPSNIGRRLIYYSNFLCWHAEPERHRIPRIVYFIIDFQALWKPRGIYVGNPVGISWLICGERGDSVVLLTLRPNQPGLLLNHRWIECGYKNHKLV